MPRYLAEVGSLVKGALEASEGLKETGRAKVKAIYKHHFSHAGLPTLSCTQAAVPDCSAQKSLCPCTWCTLKTPNGLLCQQYLLHISSQIKFWLFQCVLVLPSIWVQKHYHLALNNRMNTIKHFVESSLKFTMYRKWRRKLWYLPEILLRRTCARSTNL